MEAALTAATARFIARNPISAKLHEQSLDSLPGGNTRSLLHTAPFPIFIQRGEGSKVFDEDGHEYIDLVGEMTAGIYGHSHPVLKEALKWAIDNRGLSLGATTAAEQRYAALLCGRFGLERIRFANSGTEANLHCLAAARAFTGRRRVVVFRGGYHGGVLSFADGVSANVVDRGDWVVLQYNDAAGVSAAFAEERGQIAAVLVEAVQAAGGGVCATVEFMDAIREETAKDGALFILDEVVTSRLAPGGMGSLLRSPPDMRTLGKYLGGGMPFGAFGGRTDVMAVYDPRSPGSLAHSGTFQNNTLMLHAGLVALSEICTPGALTALNEKGSDLRRRLDGLFRGTRLCVLGRGSVMCVHATTTGLAAGRVSCRDDVAAVEDGVLRRLFWLEMLEAGFWVQSRGSIALNFQMSGVEIDAFVEAVGAFVERNAELVRTRK